MRAGSDKQTQRVVVVNGRSYGEHRVIYMMHHGYLPEHQVDHINRNPLDNRIENLREASPLCNTRNRGVFSSNKTGVTGVFRSNNQYHHGRYIAQIKPAPDKKVKHIGIFDSLDDAVKARWKAEGEAGFPNCNTTSAAYQYLVRRGLI